MIPPVPVMLWALALGRSACLPVSGDRILAEDMAHAVPAFAGMAPGIALSYAPAPGARRIFGAAELARLARRYGLAVEPGAQACFARPILTLTRVRVAAALAAVWPAAPVELLDFSHGPVPPGELRFAPSAAETGNERLWQGVVFRPGQPDFRVWARVRVQVSGTRAIAAAPLPPGLPISSAQVRAESYQGSLGLPDPSQVVGRIPRRPIPAGTAIQAQWLEDPAEVRRGERVEVEVRSGRARVLLEGQAQSSGRRGQAIAVRNPANGKVFRATIQNHGRVTLAADPPGPYVAEGAGP